MVVAGKTHHDSNTDPPFLDYSAVFEWEQLLHGGISL